jgi:CRP/FNR family transcriptional regulator, cyclic AMP receptor protein
MESLERILTEIPLFRDMKPQHLELIAGCASNVRFEAGEFGARYGEAADRFWVVRQGRMALEIHAPGRGTVTIQTVGENEVLGWSWLLPPHQWHFDARALTMTRALMFDGRCLRGKFEHDYELGYEMMRRFAQIIVQRLESTGLQLLDVYGDH